MSKPNTKPMVTLYRKFKGNPSSSVIHDLTSNPKFNIYLMTKPNTKPRGSFISNVNPTVTHYLNSNPSIKPRVNLYRK